MKKIVFAEAAICMVLLELIMARQTDSIFVVDEDLCYGCGACIALCPINVLILDNRLAIVDEENCTHCKHCIPSCPVFALSIEEVVN